MSDIHIAHLCFEDSAYLKRLSESHAHIVAIDAGCEQAEVHRVTKEIMRVHPIPVVILVEQDRQKATAPLIAALDAGALTVIPLPGHDDAVESADLLRDLGRNLRLMAEVKVVRRWDGARFESLQRILHPVHDTAADGTPAEVIAMGASAGGTKALQEIFRDLREDFPLPIFVVQHIAKGYIRGLARWLDEQTRLQVKIAEDGTMPQSGTIYLAPDDYHLTVAGDRRILLSAEESTNGFRPSIAQLFSSVARTYQSKAVAVLLSGMGNDGAAEMRRLYDLGALTIAQDKETSLIHGIPGEAIKLQAARFILPIQEIGTALEAAAARKCISLE
ncbi:MAG: chemotaxis response regulator protein-glutamate methylesterase [Bacteroidetes bacterium]|nr:chemotaxis response regulator protein-glutamate methylesterase [Bacteroidota bacterium]